MLKYPYGKENRKQVSTNFSILGNQRSYRDGYLAAHGPLLGRRYYSYGIPLYGQGLHYRAARVCGAPDAHLLLLQSICKRQDEEIKKTGITAGHFFAKD